MSGGAPGGIFPAMVVPSQRAVVRWRQCGNAACTRWLNARPKTEFRKSRSSKKLNNMEKANEEMRVYLEQHKIEEVFVS